MNVEDNLQRVAYKHFRIILSQVKSTNILYTVYVTRGYWTERYTYDRYNGLQRAEISTDGNSFTKTVKGWRFAENNW